MSKDILFNLYSHIRKNSTEEKIVESNLKAFAPIKEKKDLKVVAKERNIKINEVKNKIITYKMEAGNPVAIVGDWKYISEEPETTEELSYGYSNGDNPSDAVHSLEDFIGISFHLIQQTAGRLTYKGKEVNATTTNQTSGDTAEPSWKVKYDGKIVTLADLGVNSSGVKVTKEPVEKYIVETPEWGIVHFDSKKEAEKYAKKVPGSIVKPDPKTNEAKETKYTKLEEATGEKIIGTFSDEEIAKKVAQQNNGLVLFDEKEKIWKVTVKENIEIVVSEEGDPKAVVDVNTETGEITAKKLEDDETDKEIEKSKVNEGIQKELSILNKAYDVINEPSEGEELVYRNQLVDLCSKVAMKGIESIIEDTSPLEPNSSIYVQAYNAIVNFTKKKFNEKELDKILLLCQNIDADAEKMEEDSASADKIGPADESKKEIKSLKVNENEESYPKWCVIGYNKAKDVQEVLAIRNSKSSVDSAYDKAINDSNYEDITVFKLTLENKKESEKNKNEQLESKGSKTQESKIIEENISSSDIAKAAHIPDFKVNDIVLEDDTYILYGKNGELGRVSKEKVLKYMEQSESKINKENKLTESVFTRYASTDEQEEAISALEKTLKKLNKKIRGGTTIGKAPQTVILDLTYQGSEIYVNRDGIVEINDQEVDPADNESVKNAIEKNISKSEKISESSDDFTVGYSEALQKSLKEVLGVSVDIQKIINKLKSLQREELETLKKAMEISDIDVLKHFLNSIL